MKNTIGLTLFAIAAIALVSVGCNQQGADRGADNTAETSLVSVSENACCGKCATEAATLAEKSKSKTAGCCGKCGGGTATLTTGKQDCESCSAEKQATAAGCQNGCKACAEGGSANCKCGDESDSNSETAEQAEGSVDEKDAAHVNSMPEDRDIFHHLLENHEKISRTVTELKNGVKTVTESTDPAIAAKIQEHVASMQGRVEDGRPLRMWDELYREIFKHADKIEMSIEKTANGISVTETSDDEYVVKLIQSHAKVVSGFAKRGFEEARENHEPPKN